MARSQTTARTRSFFVEANARRLILLGFLLITSGCAQPQYARMLETTAYCDCSLCCNWERGNWRYLKLDFWNKYVSSGARAGRPYDGLTAVGTSPREPEEGFFSLDSLQRPWMIPIRLLFFPWMFLPHDGTIAANTQFYPFGTRMYVSGYGWGMVEDRGGAIKGASRIDLYFDSHGDALTWGRQMVEVTIEPPGW